MKKTIIPSIFLISIILLTCLVIAAPITQPRITIPNIPKSADVASTFNIGYVVEGVSGNWNTVLITNVDGGCTFSDGLTHHEDTLSSSKGTTFSQTFKTPNKNTSCLIWIEYNFGSNLNSSIGSSFRMAVGPGGGHDGNWGDPEGFDINGIVFKLGDFGVTWLMIIIAGVLVILLLLFKKK
jgi:hypothetical protein